MKVVTSGSAYLDIDAYAGCIAYAELLNLQGDEAVAASTAPLNKSITPSLRNFGKHLVSQSLGESDSFHLIDVSEPNFFDPLVDQSRVEEIIDHHPGFETYWQDRIGEGAQIEVVGAACTQVVERWQTAGLLDKIDISTATLLAAGILDNTLNFTAGVTRERDHKAYDALKSIAGLPDDFAARYFSECQAAIEADLELAIKNDAKNLKDIAGLPLFMGQIVVWNGGTLLRDKKAVIEQTMGKLGEDWGLNLISIEEAKSYFLAQNPDAQKKFVDLFGVSFSDGVSNPHAMMLRKEILKAALDKAKDDQGIR